MTTPDTIQQLRAAAELAAREQRPLTVNPGAVLALLDACAVALSERDAARAEVELLRQLDQLDQALSAMSVVEVDHLQARVNDTLVPQLARMLAFMLVKEDGTFYNYISWALGVAEPLGPLEMVIQREQGKTPVMIALEARASEAEAWEQAGSDRADLNAAHALLGRLDDYLETCESQPTAARRAMIRKLRGEIKKARGG